MLYTLNFTMLSANDISIKLEKQTNKAPQMAQVQNTIQRNQVTAREGAREKPGLGGRAESPHADPAWDPSSASSPGFYLFRRKGWFYGASVAHSAYMPSSTRSLGQAGGAGLGSSPPAPLTWGGGVVI